MYCLKIFTGEPDVYPITGLGEEFLAENQIVYPGNHPTKWIKSVWPHPLWALNRTLVLSDQDIFSCNNL